MGIARYSGNLLRLKAPQSPHVNPGGPDESHDAPSGPETVPEMRAREISVAPDLGTDYEGLTLEDGVPRAVVAGQPGLGWNAPESASVPVGSGTTPAGTAPTWTSGDPHNAEVDTSFRGAARGSLPGSHASAGIRGVHGVGDDSHPGHLANPVGVEGTAFLEREVGFPEQVWAEPTGPGVDKFVAGTNSYGASNPEGDQYTHRGGGRVHFGFDTGYFVHTPLFQDHVPQTYEIPAAPVVSTDPLVGGKYSRTPALGRLASNPWVQQLGEAPDPSGENYGVPVDGVM